MTKYPVSTIDAVYLGCNPEEPLDANDPRNVDLTSVRYLPGDDLVERTVWQISVGGKNECLRMLLTGHRGCGKSTELLRLKNRLEAQDIFVVYLDIEEALDLGDIQYFDVLLAIARALSGALEQAEISINQDLLKDIEKWFAETELVSISENSTTGTAGAGVNAKCGIPWLASLFGKATAEIKSAGSNRETIRTKLKKDLSQFINFLRHFVLNARANVTNIGKKDLTLIIDGLEKAVYKKDTEGVSNHYELFIHHADQLKAPGCHLIYTVPISLVFEAQLGDAWPGETHVIPMIRQCSASGKAKLEEVVAKRLVIDSIFESQDTLDDFIALSGGAIRDLLRLIRIACGPSERISISDGARAMKTLIREFDRLIRNEDLERIELVAKEKRIPNANEYEWLRLHRVVHEYENGNRWAQPHPAVLYRLDYAGKPILKTME